jgi:hypothetical protein
VSDQPTLGPPGQGDAAAPVVVTNEPPPSTCRYVDRLVDRRVGAKRQQQAIALLRAAAREHQGNYVDVQQLAVMSTGSEATALLYRCPPTDLPTSEPMFLTPRPR